LQAGDYVSAIRRVPFIFSKMILRSSLPLVVICGICELSMVAAEDPALDQNDHVGAGDQIVSQAPLGFFTPATIPTKPRSIQSICPEWEPLAWY